jgi:ATP-binding cassette, subfamily B, multidrug efflux pump
MRSFDLIRPYFKESRLRIAIGLACLAIVDFLQLIIPRVVKHTVDDLTMGGAVSAHLLTYGLNILGLAVLIGIFRYIWRKCLIGMSRRLEEGLRNHLFSHIQKLSAGYFDQIKTGDLMAHATNDINHVRMAAGMGMVALTDAVVLGTAAIGFMAYINLKLTLLVLIPMPFIVFSTRFIGRKMHRRYQQVQAAFSDLTETVREQFAGIRIIKAYTREAESESRLRDISKEYITKNLRLVRITRSFFPLMVLFSNFSMAIILFWGGRLTITADITPGDFVAFIAYLGLLTWPMMALGWLTNLIQRGKASLDRIADIISIPPAIADPADPQRNKNIRGKIVFDRVQFRYGNENKTNGNAPVLDNVSFTVRPGEIIGVVGPPGSGKTSLLQLIPRLYDVSSGGVSIDGVDVRQYPLQQLRGLVAFMPQEPFLFSDTVRENIVLAAPQVADRALDRAISAASLTDAIQSFSHGLESIVGEKGVILSGGQKQRVALARALMSTAPVVILDDPISQVDAQTGGEIIQTIRSMAGEKTLLIVSHRISALEFADTIMVLENGRITGSGDHQSLLDQNPYYARTWRLQKLEEEFHAG